jgi:hypothetical protein
MGYLVDYDMLQRKAIATGGVQLPESANMLYECCSAPYGLLPHLATGSLNPCRKQGYAEFQPKG